MINEVSTDEKSICVEEKSIGVGVPMIKFDSFCDDKTLEMIFFIN